MIGFLGIGRHQRLQILLSSYVDGQVTSSEAAQVERHLSGCEQCQRDLDNLRATVGLLRALPELDIPRSFAVDVAPEPVQAPWPPAWASGVAATAAAVMLIALLTGDLFGLLRQTGQVTREEALVDMAVEKEAATEEQAPVEAARAVAAPQAAPAPAPKVAAASEAEVVVTVVVEAEMEAAPAAAAMAPPAASPEATAPPEAPVAAAAAPPPAPPEDGAIADVPASREVPVEATPGPEKESRALETATFEPEEVEPAGRAVILPLRELELGVRVLFVVLLFATLALVVRRRRAL